MTHVSSDADEAMTRVSSDDKKKKINIQEINLMIEIPSSDFSVDHFHRKKAIMGSLI
jgi:hypothetical protein